MKQKLFEHVGGNQFTLVKGLEPVNEMPVGDAKRKRDFSPLRRLEFGELLNSLSEVGIVLNNKQELELFKDLAEKRSGHDSSWPPAPTRPNPRGPMGE